MPLYKHLSKQFKQFLLQHSRKKKEEKNETVTAITTPELSYFNCDLQIAIRDEGAGMDIDNEPPPIPSLKQKIVSYKSTKYHFEERKTVRLEFLRTATQ